MSNVKGHSLSCLHKMADFRFRVAAIFGHVTYCVTAAILNYKMADFLPLF